MSYMVLYSRHSALPYSHLLANFWNRIGYWLLNKLIKQTFIWRKNNFFLEFHIRFNLKSFIKSLIFKNFFSGWIALCLHFTFTFTAHPHRVADSVLNTICDDYYLNTKYPKPFLKIILGKRSFNLETNKKYPISSFMMIWS